MSEISEEKLTKALANLEALSKSHNTATTKIEPMAAQDGSTQVFHTPSNSDPSMWAGSKQEDVPGNGPGVDRVKLDESGTDLRMMKSILAKLAKGMDLSEDEKKVVAKAMKEDEDGHDDEEHAKKLIREMVPGAKKDGPMHKSLLEAAQETPSVREGFEMSTFLRDQTAVLSKSLVDMEARIKAHVDAQIASVRGEYGEVAKSFADIATVVGATSHKISSLENSAARAPKSAVAQNNVLNKSLQAPPTDVLSKSLVGDALYAMMASKEIAPIEEIKFDTTGELPRDLEAKVRKHLSR